MIELSKASAASDEMIDPRTGEIWRIPPSLLIGDFWERSPASARAMVAEWTSSDVAGQASNQERLGGLASMFEQALKCALVGPGESPSDQVGRRGKASPRALVLGHALRHGGLPSSEMLARLDVAMMVRGQFPDAKMILSGGGGDPSQPEAFVMKRLLLDRGVPRSDLIVESRSMDTVENVMLSDSVAGLSKEREIVLVTSAFHMRRSHGLLRAHLSGQKSDSTVVCCASGDAARLRPETMESGEMFLLFKDLGRIMGLWDYKVSKIR